MDVAVLLLCGEWSGMLVGVRVVVVVQSHIVPVVVQLELACCCSCWCGVGVGCCWKVCCFGGIVGLV